MATATPLTNAHLMAAPFHLDAGAVDWVRRTHAAMDPEAKLAQIVIPACRDLSEPALDALAARGLGGMHRFPSYGETELRGSASKDRSGKVVTGFRLLRRAGSAEGPTGL